MMKKILSRALICATLLSATVAISSCDSETIAAIISELLNTGTTYTYSGTGNAESLIANGKNYTSDKKVTGTFNVSVKVASTGATADLTIPAFTCGSLTMSEVVFSGLTLSTKDNHNVLSLNENTTALGTINHNGQTYDVTNLYIECTLDDSQISITSMSIFFGPENEAGTNPFAMNFTYAGKVIAQ